MIEFNLEDLPSWAYRIWETYNWQCGNLETLLDEEETINTELKEIADGTKPFNPQIILGCKTLCNWVKYKIPKEERKNGFPISIEDVKNFVIEFPEIKKKSETYVMKTEQKLKDARNNYKKWKIEKEFESDEYKAWLAKKIEKRKKEKEAAQLKDVNKNLQDQPKEPIANQP